MSNQPNNHDELAAELGLDPSFFAAKVPQDGAVIHYDAATDEFVGPAEVLALLPDEVRDSVRAYGANAVLSFTPVEKDTEKGHIPSYDEVLAILPKDMPEETRAQLAQTVVDGFENGKAVSEHDINPDTDVAVALAVALARSVVAAGPDFRDKAARAAALASITPLLEGVVNDTVSALADEDPAIAEDKIVGMELFTDDVEDLVIKLTNKALKKRRK